MLVLRRKRPTLSAEDEATRPFCSAFFFPPLMRKKPKNPKRMIQVKRMIQTGQRMHLRI